eukprot:9325753-Pyramimonas_sp.AAC.3
MDADSKDAISFRDLLTFLMANVPIAMTIEEHFAATPVKGAACHPSIPLCLFFDASGGFSTETDASICTLCVTCVGSCLHAAAKPEADQAKEADSQAAAEKEAKAKAEQEVKEKIEEEDRIAKAKAKLEAEVKAKAEAAAKEKAEELHLCPETKQHGVYDPAESQGGSGGG